MSIPSRPVHRPRNHYDFLDEHFQTILANMGQEELAERTGNFSSSGDKYHQYQDIWENNNIPFFHGAAMYHLLELIYPSEARQTKNGWVAPQQWVIDNYREGHKLSRYMEGLE